jgi:hypothetical protein
VDLSATRRRSVAASALRIELERRFDVPLRYGCDDITDLRNWPECRPGPIRAAAGSRPGVRGAFDRLLGPTARALRRTFGNLDRRFGSIQSAISER